MAIKKVLTKKKDKAKLMQKEQQGEKRFPINQLIINVLNNDYIAEMLHHLQSYGFNIVQNKSISECDYCLKLQLLNDSGEVSDYILYLTRKELDILSVCIGKREIFRAYRNPDNDDFGESESLKEKSLIYFETKVDSEIKESSEIYCFKLVKRLFAELQNHFTIKEYENLLCDTSEKINNNIRNFVLVDVMELEGNL